MASLILVIAVGVFAAALVPGYIRKKDIQRQIDSLSNFTPAVRYERAGWLSLMLDPMSEQIAIAEPTKAVRLYGFDQLVAIEIERNGFALDKLNRGSALAGAAIGGALLGPAGLLLGGLTGPKRRDEKVKRLTLRLYTNDLHSPFTEIVFFEDKSGVKPSEKPVKQAALLLEEWYGRILSVLRTQEQGGLVEKTAERSGSYRRRSLLPST